MLRYNDELVQEDLGKIVEDGGLEKLRGKAILITGAGGMLAAYYMATLMYLNDVYGYKIKIYALVRSPEKLKEMADFEKRGDVKLVIQDVREPILIEEKIDYILHAASAADPGTLTKAPVAVIEANTLGTRNVLEFAKKSGAKVIFTSTREVYGGVSGVEKIRETDMGALFPTEVRSCYPESKRLAENLIVSYAYQYGIKYEIARLAHAYGPGMKIFGDGRIMADLIGSAVEKRKIVLKSSGEDLRAFCYAADAVRALLLITVSDEENQVYNVANETEEISILALAKEMAGWYGLEVETGAGDKSGGAAYVNFKRTPLDTEKIKKLGWRPKYSLEEGIKRTVEYCTSDRLLH